MSKWTRENGKETRNKIRRKRKLIKLKRATEKTEMSNDT